MTMAPSAFVLKTHICVIYRVCKYAESSGRVIGVTSKEPVCPRVELILKIIIILLIISLGFNKSKPC